MSELVFTDDDYNTVTINSISGLVAFMESHN